jgi:hypothetical protein
MARAPSSAPLTASDVNGVFKSLISNPIFFRKENSPLFHKTNHEPYNFIIDILTENST